MSIENPDFFDPREMAMFGLDASDPEDREFWIDTAPNPDHVVDYDDDIEKIGYGPR